MTGILGEEFSRAFVNKRFWMVGVLAVLSFAYGLGHTLQFQEDFPGDALSLWQAILVRGCYGFFAALMAGLPYADALLADRRHHYLAQILLRCRYHSYVWARILANLCAGAVAVAVPMLLLLLGCLLVLPLDVAFLQEIPYGVSAALGSDVIEPGAFLLPSLSGYVALSLGLGLAFGAGYASLGLAASLLVRSPFAALGAPFVVYSAGYYIIPTSAHLRWALVSTEAALLPESGLFSPLAQYLGLALVVWVCWAAFGRRQTLLQD